MFVFLHGEDTLGTGEGLREGMAGFRSLFSALGRTVFPSHSLLWKKEDAHVSLSSSLVLPCILLTAAVSGAEQPPLLLLKQL